MVSESDEQNNQSETSNLLHSNRELAILYAIAGHLNRKIDVHEALQEVLVQVTKLLDLQTGWVWLLDERGKPYLAAAQALPPYLADHPERMTGTCLCVDTFLAGGLAGASNIDVLRCSRLKNAERDADPTSWDLRFHASIPIYAGEMPLGVLNVASQDWRELNPAELQLLHIIGDQIGLAIQRATLSAEQTRSATRLATIEERNRLAREIHDTLAQGLAAITLQLETADALADSRPERAQAAIKRALNLARGNLEEARHSVMDLRVAPLQGYTLPEALALLVRQTNEQNEQQGAEVIYRYQLHEAGMELTTRIEASLYRVAQEALTNAIRHAKATQIKLILCLDETSIRLIIQDNGVGFEAGTVTSRTPSGQFGLTGMIERVKLLGGTICIGSDPGAGTCIEVTVPYQQ